MSGTVKFYALCCRNTEALKRHIETIPKEDLIVIINTLDSDFETDAPLQRTMSFAPPRR